ncbi:MAG: hypothetical protein ACLFUJ_16815, partial [Phycisphaerae bacterium]
GISRNMPDQGSPWRYTPSSRMHIEDMLETWVGVSVHELVRYWDMPQRKENRPNGEMWLFYNSVESYDDKGPELFVVWFMADSRGIIYSWQWDYDDL